ncbi:hypothetical protein LPTSP4_03190 [Leptospira ryugenii]|uniref:Uncharacterized protein n=1 Tax=Leptospira ryugenii TaxID=1917863 RepID=A0A2P2DW06_9LEPT|nr:hypothetical protein [Leptospira ryugenii]GBF48819.1 hypothetical protein LPTSP4_03190 [Leptospira ryugenii]
MDKDILKGNFKTKKEVDLDKVKTQGDANLQEELKQKVLATLGGSMVYVERNKLTWDGEEEK